jgi:hypothetical protein
MIGMTFMRLQAAAGFFLDLRGRWVHFFPACFKFPWGLRNCHY